MPIIRPLKRTICPLCCKQFHLSRAVRRPAPNTRGTRNDEQDVILGQFLNIQPPLLPPAEPLGRHGLGRYWVPRDLLQNWRLLCPHCHFVLPVAATNGLGITRLVAVIGPRSSGKSHYLGVLLRQMRSHYSNDANLYIQGLTSLDVLNNCQAVPSDDLLQARYENDIFLRKQTLTATTSGRTNPAFRVPLLYRVAASGRRHLKPAELALFDAAGEDLQDPDNAQKFCRYVTASSGIILLFDPFEIPAVRERLPQALRNTLPSNMPVAHPESVLMRMLEIIEPHEGYRPNQRLPMPLAVVLSKCDLLPHTGLVSDDSLIMRDCRHQGGVNVRDIAAVSDQVESLLRACGAGNLINTVHARFSQACFFAVSALGSHPTRPANDPERLHIPVVQPRRVGDPLLWLLYKMGCLPESPLSRRGRG